MSTIMVPRHFHWNVSSRRPSVEREGSFDRIYKMFKMGEELLGTKGLYFSKLCPLDP